MADDLEVIRELEQLLGLKLKMLDSEKDIWKTWPSFYINKNKHIQSLNLIGCDLTQYPESIAKLIMLKELVLSNNRLTKLPESIAQLTNLTLLYLNNNKLTILPESITQLKNLKGIFLEGNKLTTLPESITILINLTHLGLIYNEFKTIPDSIAKLTNLTHLSLDYNRLTTLPESIAQLTNISFLSLSYNQFKNIPKSIGKLSNLTHLYLRSNNLSTIPDSIARLNNLTLLDLRSNQITHFPEFLLDLDLNIYWDWNTKDGIYLSGNPLEPPPVEIIQKGKQAIRDYFNSLHGEKKALNEVKVLLVGDGGSGKTSLVKQLYGEEYNVNESQTHGIKIRDKTFTFNNKTITAHFWDFGGQQIMHHTHQFFLSSRSLYILVLDGRKEQDEEYWLKHIRSFGGDSPILVVINKIDENPGFELNRKFLSDKYPSIKGYFRISCKNCEGIIEFINSLEQELEKIEHLKITWPASWFGVKDKLQNMTVPFINMQEFNKICDIENIPNNSGRETLVEFLHDLGVVVHFKDFALRDVHVLEPKWVTSAVYRIINSNELAEHDGRLNLCLLENILQKKAKDDYDVPADKHKYIIELMKKFELCYELDHDIILLPNLLPVPEPEFQFDYDHCLRFVIEYDFLPKSIIPRFIVKMNQDITDKNLQWRTGVVLKNKAFNSIAVIKADEQEKCIYIYVNGSQKRDYFATIRKTFWEINSSFEKLLFKELVPLPDKPGITIEYDELLGYEIQKEEKILIGKMRKYYNVSELLNGVVSEIQRAKDIDKLSPDFNHPLPEPQVKPVEEKKKWYQTLWVVLVGLVIILSGIAYIFQIWESQTFKNLFKINNSQQSQTETQSQSPQSPQDSLSTPIQPAEKK